MTKRDPVIDGMRGLGIVLMVLGHSGFWGEDFIYLFHMALFFLISGWLWNGKYSESPAGLWRFVKNKLRTLWLPFVAANTAYTVCNNLFLRLGILTQDERILALPGNITTEPVTLKDIVGRTLHWCVFDGGTQLGGALWFVQALFQISILYAAVDFALKKLLHGRSTAPAQGAVSGALLFVGWQCGQAGWNVWGLGIVCSCYCLFFLGTALRRLGQPARRPWQRAALGAAAFAALCALLRFGTVGLAGNAYPNWVFLLAASLAGWVLVYECAHLLALCPPAGAALAALGRVTLPVAALHFLAFKAVTRLGLCAAGGEGYLLAAFPVYFTGGAWWLAYTAAGLALPCAAHALWQKARAAVRGALQKSAE